MTGKARGKTGRKLEIRKSSYVLKFDFASFDPVPTIDDVCRALEDGLRDDFPNCSMIVTKAEKSKTTCDTIGT